MKQFILSILSINKRNSNAGFTLIELLVVTLIMGVLATISLPNLLNQVEKARLAEAKNNLGAINRAQQAYMFENGIFANSLDEISWDLTVGNYNGSSYETKYFVYSVTGTPDGQSVFHHAAPQSDQTSNLRGVASAVFRQNMAFTSVICEGDALGVQPEIVDSTTCNNGKLVF
jgi:type IV pilus assembly protein PilA